MKEYATIGKTKIRFDESHKGGNMIYTMMTRQGVKNVLVDCDYYEGSDCKNIQYYTFHITIKVFGKHPHKPVQWYEIYANTLYPKYNYINRCTKTTDRKIVKESEDFIKLNKVLGFINENFENFTIQFVDYATKTINNRIKTKDTPKFIVDMINEFNNVKSNEKVLK